MIKAIPTTYSGCEFESRLEARWAVFFDQIDVEWEYEPEGFKLPSGWYLPDFWIPDWHAYVEIKPRECPDTTNFIELRGSRIDKAAFSKCHDLALAVDSKNASVIMLAGSPKLDGYAGLWWSRSAFNDSGEERDIPPYSPELFKFMECRRCHQIYHYDDDIGASSFGKAKDPDCSGCTFKWGYLETAYDAAQAMKFHRQRETRARLDETPKARNSATPEMRMTLALIQACIANPSLIGPESVSRLRDVLPEGGSLRIALAVAEKAAVSAQETPLGVDDLGSELSTQVDAYLADTARFYRRPSAPDIDARLVSDVVTWFELQNLQARDRELKRRLRDPSEDHEDILGERNKLLLIRRRIKEEDSRRTSADDGLVANDD